MATSSGGGIMGKQMSGPFDLLLGRKTYEIFAAYWPNASPADQPFAAPLNNATKYVATRTLKELSWQNSRVITGDLVAEIRKLKSQDGPPLQVHGSGNLVQTLMKHDLADEFWLKIFPVTLGPGKRLFADGTIPPPRSGCSGARCPQRASSSPRTPGIGT
jgi:dihydrofolate reductase